jgi:hypothetical protein
MKESEDRDRMSDVAPAPLPFGTGVALFQTPQAAQEAVAALVAQGYPRQLITILGGKPWTGTPADEHGIVPDPELRFQLTPASSPDAESLALHTNGARDPALAAFAGNLVDGRGRRRNPATLPLITLAISIVAVLISLYSGWEMATTVGLIAFHVVVGVAVFTYTRDNVVTFPFRSRIPAVEEALEKGGVLVTVRYTRPYASRVEAALRTHGGEVLGYAPEVVYPVVA